MSRTVSQRSASRSPLDRGEPARMVSYTEVDKRKVIELGNLNSNNIVKFFERKDVLIIKVDGKKTIDDINRVFVSLTIISLNPTASFNVKRFLYLFHEIIIPLTSNYNVGSRT